MHTDVTVLSRFLLALMSYGSHFNDEKAASLVDDAVYPVAPDSREESPAGQHTQYVRVPQETCSPVPLK